MIKLLKELIYRNSKGKTVLFFFILTNLVYLSMLTVTIPKVMTLANGMKLPDMMPTGYDFDYVNNLFTALGEKGRWVYLYNQIPLDMIYPLLFGIGYSLLFAYFLKKIKLYGSHYFYFTFLPIISGISDYIENIGIIAMIRQYPDLSAETVSITNTFSILKSSTTTIFFVALIILLIVFVVQFVKSKKAFS
jgi:hypothetical protein